MRTVVSKDLTLAVSYSGYGDSPEARLPYAEIDLVFWVANETNPMSDFPAYRPAAPAHLLRAQ